MPGAFKNYFSESGSAPGSPCFSCASRCWPVRPAAGDQGHGKYVSHDPKRRGCGDVLPDAHQYRDHPGRRGRHVRGKDGPDQHLADRAAAVIFYGIRGEGIAGSGGVVPQRGPVF